MVSPSLWHVPPIYGTTANRHSHVTSTPVGLSTPPQAIPAIPAMKTNPKRVPSSRPKKRDASVLFRIIVTPTCPPKLREPTTIGQCGVPITSRRRITRSVCDLLHTRSHMRIGGLLDDKTVFIVALLGRSVGRENRMLSATLPLLAASTYRWEVFPESSNDGTAAGVLAQVGGVRFRGTRQSTLSVALIT